MTKKEQYELNNSIVALIEAKRASKEPFTQEEILYIRKYSGIGGLADKGASGRGLLYEFYTPYEIIEKMWGLAYKHGFKEGSKILEPSCGIGRFLEYVNPDLNEVVAYEFSKDNTISYDIAKLSFPKFTIINDYFESHFYNGNKRVGAAADFNLVIGNPPYGKFDGKYAGKGREGNKTLASSYEHYFLEKGIALLKPGGLLIFIVPTNTIDTLSSYANFKASIAQQAELLDAYRLPYGVFDFTGIQTDIVVFQKK